MSTASIASVARAPAVLGRKPTSVRTKPVGTQPAAAPQAAQSSAAAVVNAATAALKKQLKPACRRRRKRQKVTIRRNVSLPEKMTPSKHEVRLLRTAKERKLT